MEEIAERLKSEFPVLQLSEPFVLLMDKVKAAEMKLRITSAF